MAERPPCRRFASCLTSATSFGRQWNLVARPDATMQDDRLTLRSTKASRSVSQATDRRRCRDGTLQGHTNVTKKIRGSHPRGLRAGSVWISDRSSSGLANDIPGALCLSTSKQNVADINRSALHSSGKSVLCIPDCSSEYCSRCASANDQQTSPLSSG